MSNGMMLMGGRHRTSLAAWIANALVELVDEMPCGQLMLFHVGLTGAETEIHTKVVHPGMSPDEVAAMFIGRGETYAQDLIGDQSFLLVALYGKSSRRQLPLRIKGNSGVGANGLGLYDASDDRGPKQLMTNGLTAALSLVLNKMGTLFEASDRMIDKMAAREQTLVKENTDAWVIMKEMWMKEITLQHELKMKEIERATALEDRKAFWTFAPALLNTLTGTEVVPQETADSAIMKSIAKELLKKPEKDRMAVFAKFAEMGIPPQMIGVIASRFSAIADQVQEEEKNKAKALGAGGNVDDELGQRAAE